MKYRKGKRHVIGKAEKRHKAKEKKNKTFVRARSENAAMFSTDRCVSKK